MDPVRSGCQWFVFAWLRWLSTAYQWLSIGSGGQRYPSCDTGSYGAIIQGVVNGIKIEAENRCSIKMPDLSLYPNNTGVAVLYTPMSSGRPNELVQVDGPVFCDQGDYYYTYDDDIGVAICPAVCAAIEADPNPLIKFRLGCRGPA